MSTNKDSAELEALFDQTLAQSHPQLTQAAHASSPSVSNNLGSDHPPELYEQIGILARKLHNALQEIGKGDALANANSHLPEDRERLAFIGKLMEQSAEKVLTTCEDQMPILEQRAKANEQQRSLWLQFIDGKMSLSDFKTLALEQPEFFQQNARQFNQSKDAFLHIVMAQDFQDLAGQTLSKIIKHVTELEQDLIRLLAFAAVEPARKEKIEEFLAGPQFTTEKSKEVVGSQEEVDDLLRDLGF